MEHELLYNDSLIDSKIKETSKSLGSYPPILGPLPTCNKTLKDYQERYVRLNHGLRRTLLASSTGSGKSIMAFSRYKVLNDKSLLIICPKILKTNWQENIRLDFNEDSLVYWGTDKQKAKIDLASKNIVITTYETVKDLTRFDFEHLIVDEAQLLSDPKSLRFKIFKKYFDALPNLKSIQLLSGTPIQHKPKDLWSLIHILDPYKAGSYIGWCDEYEEVVKSFRKQIPIKDKSGRLVKDANGAVKTFEKQIPLITRTRNLDKLRDKLSTIMFRVSREDALDCKEEEELVYLDLTKAQERLYHSLKNEILVELENRTLSINHAPVRMLRLLQACEGLFNFDSKSLESTKLDYLSYEIENLEDKLVIWTRFKPLTYILKTLYPDKVVIYNGDLSEKEKLLSIQAFNGIKDQTQAEIYSVLQKRLEWPFDPGQAKVFVGVIDARSSLGFDLHEQCNRQIFSSFSFLSSSNYQASSRLVRLGQKNNVLTQYLTCRNTIEPDALNLVLRNFSTALKIVDGEDSIHYSLVNKLIGLLKMEY